MSRQLRIIEIPLDQLTAVLRGDKRISNLPFDAAVVGLHQAHKRVGLCICSNTYSHTPPGELLPISIAIVRTEAVRDALMAGKENKNAGFHGCDAGASTA